MNIEVKPKDSESRAIIKATNQEKPEKQDIEALNKLFDENPEYWENIGNIAKRVRDTIIQNNLGKNHLIIEATKRKLADLRDQLNWENSSQLEKIIIEQVCLNWLRFNLLQIIHSNKTSESHALTVGEHWDKLLTTAQSRYLRACESLAKVRKLLAEAELKEQQARNKRSQSTLIAQKIRKF